MASGSARFQFDDPADSWWNGGGGSAFASKQLEARVAMGDLFESGSSPYDFGDGDGLLEAAEPSLQPHPEEEGGNVPNEQAVDGGGGGDGGPVRAHHKDSDLGLATTGHADVRSASGSIASEPSSQHMDYARLRNEHHKLVKHLEVVRSERYQPPPVDEAVRRMARGQAVPLDLYRTVAQKHELLDAAIASCDTSAVLAVLDHMRRTVSDRIFRETLASRPMAAEHFVQFLKDTRQFRELQNVLLFLGRNTDSAMVELANALRECDPERRAQSALRCLQSGLADPQLSHEASLVRQFAALVERQLQIERVDSEAEKAGERRFLAQPRRATLPGQPALHTLYYAALYHLDAPATSSNSAPESIRSLCELDERQFIWTSVAALARLARWPDVDRLLARRSMLGSNKLSCPFPWTKLVEILTCEQTPPPKDLLCRVLRSVSDPATRLNLAEKHEATDVVIECLVAAKDRLRLGAYLTRLAAGSADAIKTANALKATTVKWTN